MAFDNLTSSSQSLSDFAALYGLSAPIDYLTFCGLTLNGERVRVRRIWDAVTADHIATGKQEVPDEWINYLIDNPDEAVYYLRRKRQLEMLTGVRKYR